MLLGTCLGHVLLSVGLLLLLYSKYVYISFVQLLILGTHAKALGQKDHTGTSRETFCKELV